jgi:hypothetical protein
MRWNGPSRTGEPGRSHSDLRKLAAENRLEVRTATNIPVTDDEDVAHTIEFQDALTRTRAAPHMQDAIGKISSSEVHPLEPAFRGARAEIIGCHVAQASMGECSARCEIQPIRRRTSTARTRECVGTVKSRSRSSAEPAPAFSFARSSDPIC